jgi:hypothetical protein
MNTGSCSFRGNFLPLAGPFTVEAHIIRKPLKTLA